MRDLITHPPEWRGPELARRTDWIRPFKPEFVDELDAALRGLDGVGGGGDRSLLDIRREDVPLPHFAEDLAEMRDALQNGPCVQLYTGFPVERYSEPELRRLYWLIALHVGTPLSQSKYGDVLGDVRVVHDIEHLSGRGYTSDRELTFHSDGCDVTGLFCLVTAKAGGLSRLVSATAIHNEIARRRPDLLEVLYQPFMWSRLGNQMPGTPSFYRQAVFGLRDGQFVTRYLRAMIERGAEESGIAMSTAQIEALDLMDEIAEDPEFYLERAFSPGDLQFQNNLRCYHARTEFEDDDDPARKRHLLRLWLSVPNSPALPETFSDFFADTSAGAVRGGNPAHGETLVETPQAV